MQLIGRNQSPFTRRVAVTMHLLDMDFDRQELTAWQNLEAVRGFNPVGRVPSLVLDDGEVLFDSNAILDYLDELVGPERALTPPNGAERRDVLRLTACASGVTEKAVHARYEQIMRPAEKVYEGWLKHNEDQVTNGLIWIENYLTDRDLWMYGESLTQADVTTVVMYDFIATTNNHLLGNRQYPNLENLVQRAYEFDAFQRTDPRQT